MNDPINTSQQIAMTYGEMVSKFYAIERKGDHLSGYIVFTPESFNKPYDERSRTYAYPATTKPFKRAWVATLSMAPVWMAQIPASVWNGIWPVRKVERTAG